MMTPCRFSHTDNLLFYSKRHQNSIDLMDFSCIFFPLLKDWQDFLLFQDCLFSDLPVCQHETTYNYSSNFIKSKQKYLPGKLYLFHKQLKKNNLCIWHRYLHNHRFIFRWLVYRDSLMYMLYSHTTYSL